MNISAPAIERPVATTLLTFALLLAGALAYTQLPVAPLPQIDFPVISVGAALPGASPETMASSVATPLERQFGRIAGINQMTSSSQLGSTGVTMQFDLDRNIDAAARDVQAAINAARGYLPADLPSNPTYRKINPADAPVMILVMTSDAMTQDQMYDVADSDHGPEAGAGRRRGPGLRVGFVAAGRPHRGQSQSAEQAQHRPGGGALRSRRRRTSTSPKARWTTAARPGWSGPTISSRKRPTTGPSLSPTAMALRSG